MDGRVLAVRSAGRGHGHYFWEKVRGLCQVCRGTGVFVMGSQDSGTRVTLLGRLRRDPSDPAAWAEFVDHYGAKIYGWCRRWHLQDADAQDVTQAVLLRLAAKLREFTYDPSKSFRAWLRTLTHHAWSDYLEARGRAGLGSGDSNVAQWLQSIEARDDLVRQLEDQFDHEILQEAMTRVRLRIAPQTWEAFRLTALEG